MLTSAGSELNRGTRFILGTRTRTLGADRRRGGDLRRTWFQHDVGATRRDLILSGAHPLMPISGAKLYSWQIDPRADFNLTSDDALDDLDIEFPTINGEHIGRANRYTYAVTAPLEADRVGGKMSSTIGATGGREVHDLGADWIPGEVTFVPSRGASAEDDGYLISIVTHATADAAQLQVQSAASFASPPIAVVDAAASGSGWLPRRLDS